MGIREEQKSLQVRTGSKKQVGEAVFLRYHVGSASWLVQEVVVGQQSHATYALFSKHFGSVSAVGKVP